MLANRLLLLLAAAAYIGLLFIIASFGDRRARAGRSLINSSVVYALSLAVYCTSWTFYGSVGRAAARGLDFLPIYLGPTLVFCLGWVLLGRILRVSKAHRITSIADLLGSRFGKSGTVAGLVTGIAVIGSVPYIALQLKAVSISLKVLQEYQGGADVQSVAGASVLRDTELWVAGILALFAILFGTRKIDASERHEGIVAAIAFESIIKLVSFVAVGLFAGFVLFDGFGDIFARAAARPELAKLFHLGGSSAGIDWMAMMFLAMAAIVCLPRQFQVMVVENVDERHLDRALWLFPAYLLAINLFVLPIALAGLLTVPMGTDPDSLVLTLPLVTGHGGLAFLAFLGGLSASASMVIVETVALSTMICNDLAVPILLRLGWLGADTRPVLLGIRRGAIALVVLLGFAYVRLVRESYGLASIGLVSFAAVAQFFPAIVFGLFWRRASRLGAIIGISAGFLVWAYTLLLPSVASGWLPREVFEHGLFGLTLLRPSALFGLDGLDPVTHGLFWSMLVNIVGIVGISLFVDQHALERSQAALFVDDWRSLGREEGGLWRGTAQVADLVQLVGRFLGETRTREAFAEEARRRGRDPAARAADAGIVKLAERLLAGAIGSASARVMVASVVHEEPIGAEEVMRILDETSRAIEYSRRLERQSRELEATTAELRRANERLRELDRLKDDFVSTVSHELRTPLTSIRSFSEILLDNPTLEPSQRQEFLRIIVAESERLTRLINDMLDLAKIEAGKLDWHLERVSASEVARDAATALGQLFRDKNVALAANLSDAIPATLVDRDRLFQVVVNLLSNAVKFSPRDVGRVTLNVDTDAGGVRLSVADNGPGIAPADRDAIFERFRQVGDTLTAKPEGSGLGLAISRMIIEHFGGRAWVEDAPGGGSVFHVWLPREPAAASAA
jgi:signal transduction histidine kinase/Na+/proline symporter